MNNATAIAAFSSLAYETRLAAVQLLANVGAEGLPAGDIARRLGVQKNTLSDHLRALTVAGVLNSERMGRMIVYRTNSEVMASLIQFMGETCVNPDRPK